jgi:hypothetical protein
MTQQDTIEPGLVLVTRAHTLMPTWHDIECSAGAKDIKVHVNVDDVLFVLGPDIDHSTYEDGSSAVDITVLTSDGLVLSACLKYVRTI